MEGVMKKCCGLCPYSRVDTLFLHPKRAEEFAYQSENPYNDFVCHKTGVEEEDADGSSEIVRGKKSLTCMGFATLKNNINGDRNDDFVGDPDAFHDVDEMINHHSEKYYQNHKK